MDALTLLKSDHRRVERLLARYRSANGNKAEIVREITADLTAHMDAEERELYPLLRGSIVNGESLMEDAAKEHAEARGLLAELARGEEGSFDMDAKVATLRRAIDHHVSDEENEIFPEARAALGKTRLIEIGSRLARAKEAAPAAPPAAAARKSPGSSVVGLIAAATDRVTNLLIPPVQEMAHLARRSRARKRRRTAGKSRSRARKSGRRTAAKGARKTTRKPTPKTPRKSGRSTVRATSAKKIRGRASGATARKRAGARKSK
jgi:hemerythrin superfamily protein